MKLTHTCIVSENIERLEEFYKQVVQIKPQIYGEHYIEFVTEQGTLSLYRLSAMEELAPGSMKEASNRSVLLEFQIEDVDKEYARLQQMDIDWIKPPTTQPWGNRSIYFRDPDGNLINFYSRVEKG